MKLFMEQGMHSWGPFFDGRPLLGVRPEMEVRYNVRYHPPRRPNAARNTHGNDH